MWCNTSHYTRGLGVVGVMVPDPGSHPLTHNEAIVDMTATVAMIPALLDVSG